MISNQHNMNTRDSFQTERSQTWNPPLAHWQDKRLGIYRIMPFGSALSTPLLPQPAELLPPLPGPLHQLCSPTCYAQLRKALPGSASHHTLPVPLTQFLSFSNKYPVKHQPFCKSISFTTTEWRHLLNKATAVSITNFHQNGRQGLQIILKL